MSFCTMPKLGDFEGLHQEQFDCLDRFTFKGKILAMANMLKLTNEEIYERNSILAKIIHFLKPYYPACEILIFGSSSNGFGFKGCDLDLLFLPFPEYCNTDFRGKGDDTIPSLKQIHSGQYPIEKLLSMEDFQHLRFVQRIMYTKCHFIKNVIFVPAKCPILNLEFVGNSITCDFSASNRLVIRNTELLQLFGILDQRVRPLIMVLRFWAKSLGFISKSLLSSYAFTLMVIFYLQNIQPPILLPVKKLSEMAGYSQVIDGWETAICMDRNSLPVSENSTTVDQLLIEFFEFYWNFDFIQNVISPYHGRPLPVKELKDSQDERIKEFEVTPFSIQDAFVLSRNVSRNARMKTSLKLAFLIAKELIIHKNFPYQSLFTYSVFQNEMDAKFENIGNNSPNLICFSLDLNYELSCRLGVSDNFEPWYRKVCQALLDVLQFGLLIDCEVVDSVIWRDTIIKKPCRKKRKTFGNTVALQLLMSIQCPLYYCIMHGRNNIQITEPGGEGDDSEVPSLLRKEYKISKQLLEMETGSSSVLWFMCQCYKYSATQVPDIVITFAPLCDLSSFNSKRSSLKSFVERNVKNILKEGLTSQVSSSPAKYNWKKHLKNKKWPKKVWGK